MCHPVLLLLLLLLLLLTQRNAGNVCFLHSTWTKSNKKSIFILADSYCHLLFSVEGLGFNLCIFDRIFFLIEIQFCLYLILTVLTEGSGCTLVSHVLYTTPFVFTPTYARANWKYTMPAGWQQAGTIDHQMHTGNQHAHTHTPTDQSTVPILPLNSPTATVNPLMGVGHITRSSRPRDVIAFMSSNISLSHS